MKNRKELAGNYHQLLSGHAVTWACLADTIKKILSSECLWCGSGERQIRHHLLAIGEQSYVEKSREGM